MDFYILVVLGGISAFMLMTLSIATSLVILYKMEKGGYFDE